MKTITFLGSGERIVQSPPIQSLMQKWKDGQLVMVEGAEHEVLMEDAPTRQMVYDALNSLTS